MQSKGCPHPPSANPVCALTVGFFFVFFFLPLAFPTVSWKEIKLGVPYVMYFLDAWMT